MKTVLSNGITMDGTSNILTLSDDELKDLSRKLDNIIGSANEFENEDTAKRTEDLSMMKISEAAKTGTAEEIKEDIKNTYSEGFEVRLANFQSYPLIPYYKETKEEVAPEIKVAFEHMNFTFYRVEVSFNSILPKNVYLKTLELTLVINDDVEKAERKTSVFKMFPNNKYKEYFKASFESKLALDANMNIHAKIPPSIASIIGITISPIGTIKTGIDLDLGSYSFHIAEIETAGENDNIVKWRYSTNYADAKNGDYKSIVILKIPIEAKKVTMSATLKVRPYKNTWILFDKALPELSRNLQLPIDFSSVP